MKEGAEIITRRGRRDVGQVALEAVGELSRLTISKARRPDRVGGRQHRFFSCRMITGRPDGNGAQELG